jgi:RNA polymerase sigma-70 factor, ECF subfamily
MAQGQVTAWLARWRAGGHEVLEHVVPLVYAELRQLARQQLHREVHPSTLSATALVHEVYLRLLQQRQLDAADRREFFAVVGHTMRRILVDHARARQRVKRRPGTSLASLDDHDVPLLTDLEVEEVLALETALDRLAAADARAARIVEDRIFAGMTLEETAEHLGVSAKTVQRTWLAARAWLRKELSRTLTLLN